MQSRMVWRALRRYRPSSVHQGCSIGREISQPCPPSANLTDCGISAIGRCATCNRAFCMSHQGFLLDGRPFVDRCAQCEGARVTAERAYERNYGRDFFSSGAARTTLLASDVPTVALYSDQSTWETRSFGRSRRVENIVSLGRGWLLGSFRWEFNDGGNYGGSDIEADCETMLLDRRDRPAYTEGGLSGFWGSDFIVRVRPGSHGYEIQPCAFVTSRGRSRSRAVRSSGLSAG